MSKVASCGLQVKENGGAKPGAGRKEAGTQRRMIFDYAMNAKNAKGLSEKGNGF
jgi:hypothetical protein